MKQIKITLVRSQIGSKQKQIDTLKALGLRKTNSSVIKESSQSLIGMLKVIIHLVKIEYVEGQ